MTCARTPEWPRARLATLSARTSRTAGAGSGLPTPTACESTRFFCSTSSWSLGMCVVASRPKPVLTP